MLNLENIPKLTKEQAAIVGAYTGVTAGNFGFIHELSEQLLERAIWTHEFAIPSVVEEIKEAVKPIYISICNDEND